jgi:hypothetical protein
LATSSSSQAGETAEALAPAAIFKMNQSLPQADQMLADRGGHSPSACDAMVNLASAALSMPALAY